MALIPNTFSSEKWRARCKDLFDEAARRSGLSDRLFTEFFSQATDHALKAVPEGSRHVAVEIAREFGYLDAEERARDREEDARNGLCCHGLEPDCCPLGCGDLDRDFAGAFGQDT